MEGFGTFQSLACLKTQKTQKNGKEKKRRKSRIFKPCSPSRHSAHSGPVFCSASARIFPRFCFFFSRFLLSFLFDLAFGQLFFLLFSVVDALFLERSTVNGEWWVFIWVGRRAIFMKKTRRNGERKEQGKGKRNGNGK